MMGDVGNGGAGRGSGRLTAAAEAVAGQPATGETAWAACPGQHLVAVAWVPWFAARAWEMRGHAADLIGWCGSAPRFALRDFGPAEGRRFWNDPLLNPPTSGTGGGDKGSGAGEMAGGTTRPGIAAENYDGRVASCRAAGPMDHARAAQTPFFFRIGRRARSGRAGPSGPRPLVPPRLRTRRRASGMMAASRGPTGPLRGSPLPRGHTAGWFGTTQPVEGRREGRTRRGGVLPDVLTKYKFSLLHQG